ncbi:PHP domain-containing protein [Ferrimicrobium sp.]|uniref:PHP-associated domain-containing protein n=1 Tax=Ferrimicrobium sp. TaxID=2926050 RepID=UPI002610E3C4|nr:PHP domain-containing protein [Ferrimicrobium sp.]
MDEGESGTHGNAMPGIRIDLHTHTYRSGDAKTPLTEFAAFASQLDLVAVTDHHDLRAAAILQQDYGLTVIQGEEVNTGQGEVIGLYVTQLVPRLLGLEETCRRIRSQHGLVYIPHPTDTTRKAIGLTGLVTLCSMGLVDIVEVGNSKSALVDRDAEGIAHSFGIPVTAASDAHTATAIGSSYTTIARSPVDAPDLVQLLLEGYYHHQPYDPARETHTTFVVPGTAVPNA